MTVYYALCFFIIGTFLGSFYNVVGTRVSQGESIIFPPSHCSCGHRLMPWELIPIISFILQKGRCRKCKIKLSILYPISEFITGLLFMFAFLSYGFSYELIIAITFISMIVIITLSDYYYMIIDDEVLIFFGIALIIEIFFINGFTSLLWSLLDGLIAFVVMLLLKLFGDFLFKKESMGGGDIKLMFIFGLVLNYKMAFISIFFGSLIGLPTSLILLKNKSEHIIPFGPFLSMGALIILLTQLNFDTIIKLFTF